MEELFFDPATEKLDDTTPRTYESVDYYRNDTEDFFGGVSYSSVSVSCRQGFSSQEFKDAVVRPYTGNSNIREYYKIQSLQSLGEWNNQVFVPIWIARHGRSRFPDDLNVAPAWIEHIQQAVDDINYAAPGLCLYVTSEESKAKIKIFGGEENACFAKGNMLAYWERDLYPVTIHLLDEWPEMKKTSCHELLRALGFGHEHQRQDRDSFVDLGSMEYDQLGITRFDPFSIMMYPEGQEMLHNSEDPVWFTKMTTEINREMSELDKVGLNNLYRPCRGPHYSPTIFGSTRFGKGMTGLWYCGRYFGVQCSGHDGHCGLNGPNCPACRVLKSDRMGSLWKKGKWQGWTGDVYCGLYFGVQKEGHDGYCGPDSGPPCPECYDELMKSS